MRRFPREPMFHACRGIAELFKGPGGWNLSAAERNLEKARELIREHEGTRDRPLAEMVEHYCGGIRKIMNLSALIEYHLDGLMEDEFDEEDEFDN